MFVKQNVIIAYEMVAFLSGTLRSLSVAPFEPCKHGLAYMNAAIVHYICFHNLFAAGFFNVCHCPTKKIVSHMPQVERFVGIWRGIFYHPQRSIRIGFVYSVVFV